MDVLKQFDNANFSWDVLGADTPVLVAFTAHWCDDCQELLPVFQSVVKRHAGEVVSAGSVDVDDNHDLVSQFQVHTFPSVILFSSGEEVSRFEGVKSEASMKDWINHNLQLTFDSE